MDTEHVTQLLLHVIATRGILGRIVRRLSALINVQTKDNAKTEFVIVRMDGKEQIVRHPFV